MSVPTYGDLGKSARDVFRTGYTYDLAKVKLLVPKKPYGFEVDGSLNLKSFKVGGAFTGKYETPGYGGLSTKCVFHGPLVAEYELKGQPAENADLSLGCSYSPADGFYSLKAGTAFHNAHLHATGSLTKDHDRSPDLFGSVVVKLRNFLLGYQASVNTSTSQFTKNDIACAFEEGNTAVHLRYRLQMPREFGFSAYYKVNDKVDVAMDYKLARSEGAKLWFLGAGLGCQLDEHCKLRLKLDTNAQLGSSLRLQLQEGLALSLAFSLDLGNLTSAGGHKVGMGIDVNG